MKAIWPKSETRTMTPCVPLKKYCVHILAVCASIYIYTTHFYNIQKTRLSKYMRVWQRQFRRPSSVVQIFKKVKKAKHHHQHIITSSHHHITSIITSQHHNITTSSHIITSQHHHSTASPYHHIAASPHHRITTSSHRPRWCLKVRNRTSPYVFPRNASSLWAVPILVTPSPKYWPERSLDRSVFPHLPGEGLYLLLLHLLPSTASSRSQWAVGTAGPQPQAPDLSGHCKHQISVGTAGPQE